MSDEREPTSLPARPPLRRDLMVADVARMFLWYIPFLRPGVEALAAWRPKVRAGPLRISVPLGRLLAGPAVGLLAADPEALASLASGFAERAASVLDDRELALLSAAIATELGAWNGAMDPLTPDQWRTVRDALGLGTLDSGPMVRRVVSDLPDEIDLFALARGEAPAIAARHDPEGSTDGA